MNDISTASVTHSQEQRRFSVIINGSEAVLDYQLFRDQSDPVQPAKVDFTHTWVPPELRGKGLAEKLVREGLQWARGEGLDIKASCWYVAKFLRTNSNP